MAVAASSVSDSLRDIYRKNIISLRYKPVVETVEDVQKYCPHLSSEQISTLMERARGGEIASFASPSVLVQHSYHVLRLLLSSQGKMHLEYAFPQRTSEPYAGHQAKGDISFEAEFSKEATAYAESMWPQSLIVDDWIKYGEIFLQDPTDLDEAGSPKTKAVIHWTTKREWNDIINDFSDTLSKIWNASLACFTFDLLEARELQGERGKSVRAYCSRCSAGLTPSACKVCNVAFGGSCMRLEGEGKLPEAMVPPLKAMGLLDRL